MLGASQKLSVEVALFRVAERKPAISQDFAKQETGRLEKRRHEQAAPCSNNDPRCDAPQLTRTDESALQPAGPLFNHQIISGRLAWV